jgi:hypothetical protein
MRDKINDQKAEDQNYETPAIKVINLSCEISAYAPDEEPLF